GNFTGQVLLPALKKSGARLKTIASSGGVTGTHFGKKFGFELSTTDSESILKDPDINAVFITTRHNSHAYFVLAALKAGKHVFIEKPLCLTLGELEEIQKTYSSLLTRHSSPLVMVGFNRRFAPHVVKIKELLETVREPRSFIMTVNAGFIPPDHWTQDPEVGGGRIIGEACHFVDLLRFLAGVPMARSELFGLDSPTGDTVSIQLKFADGSIGTIHYLANGSRRFPKERLEVFCGGRILQLDNFKTLRGYGWKNFKKMKLWRQDKGHRAEIKAFLEAVQSGGASPIPFDEIVEVTKTTIELSKK
ncbi:MAG TPA: Gfo/Idh/MocA family oxidoreductase, partial [Acidobacteriota bacterium]|nr:Gfo/Idh/MocA family oxidoreductase [Acidobacteriota bacterium]